MSTATTIKEWPILFSGPMVRAILDGRKTQTRRVFKMPAGMRWYGGPGELGGEADGDLCDDPGDGWYHISELSCPYGRPGDRLWVREAFFIDDYRYPDASVPPAEFLEAIEYRATHDCSNWEAGCPCTGKDWRPSIHMPRWASRITLEITEVRVERVESCSSEDAVAEGFSGYGEFINAFYEINKHRVSVLDNPWVWALAFRRVES